VVLLTNRARDVVEHPDDSGLACWDVPLDEQSPPPARVQLLLDHATPRLAMVFSTRPFTGTLLVLTLVSVGSVALHAQSVPAAERPASVLVDLGDAATSLFDAAYAADWRTAAEWMRTVLDAASTLPPDLPKRDLVGRLQAAVRYAADAVSARDRVEVMDESNAIRRIVTDLSATFQAPVPTKP
jgi:hypothetical protein